MKRMETKYVIIIKLKETNARISEGPFGIMREHIKE